ncbi:MAG: 4a-hydroxytetrahydrobiopterin dehydratase [Halioglobus sp.]
MPASLLTEQEINERLASLPGWELLDGKLYRSFKFTDFVTAFEFMSQLAPEAERMNHHPEWTNVYNRVDVSLVTHDAGGITELDFALAGVMDRLAAAHAA